MKAPTPNDLVAACLEFLRLHRVFSWRANAGGGLRRGRGGRAVPVKANPAGTPDLLGVLAPSGRLLGCECKTGAGRLNPAQRAWIDSATAAGALCLVVRDVRELEAALKREGAIR